MIYTKQANFSYPILRNGADDYSNAIFNLDVELGENQSDYILDIKIEISSVFLENLIKIGKAEMVLIIKSRDNQFYSLPSVGKRQITIPKTEISFSKKTAMQVMIKSNGIIDFKHNEELNEFYQEFKDELKVGPGVSLGFSSVIVFDGSQRKPFELFEKKLDPTINSDIEIQLGDEVITIIYKTKDMMFTDIPQNRNLTNPYIYIGLQKALMSFIINLKKDTESIEEGIDIEDITEIDCTTNLDIKLLTLLKEKQVRQLDFECLDQVIHLISDRILKKYVERVEDGYRSAN